MSMLPHINVFLSSNDNYAPFVATAVAGIVYNTKAFVNFYVLDSGISQLHKNQIMQLTEKFNNFRLEFLPISMDLFKDYGFSLKHISLDMYSRFFIKDLKPDIAKALYIDLDVAVLGDVAELHNENLDNYPLGAVFVDMPANKKRKFKYLQTKLGISPSHMYFNSGVLVFDCTKISKDFSREMLGLLNKYKNYIRFGDQDTLNKYFENNYKVLPIKYNYTNRHIQYGIKCEGDVVVRHFEGSVKPWQSNRWFRGNKVENFRDFWFFAEMTPFYAGLNADFIASKIEQGLPKKPLFRRIKERLGL